jgi:cell division protein FtsA
MEVMLSLDIGTRKVAGLLTERGPKGWRIIAAERAEHRTRTMYDGQIHDVPGVAQVVGRVLERLAARTGVTVREAAVAAAGRSLRTISGAAVRELNGLTELTPDDLLALELEAVQAAQRALAEALKEQGEAAADYHYVGHSLFAQRLDGLALASLAGQRGQVAELHVIATFLPRGVVDSLVAVLERCGLEMAALTLEPIAAISVAVPETMRHLNLVLVDIGAGTSDIAVTAKGTVVAYDMVPVAGDEVTEALSERYLLDFTVGEAVKRRIDRESAVTFADILGSKRTVTSKELAEACLPAVRALAEQIAARLLKLNGGPPQAVILVGGGSLSPGLPQCLAAALGLAPGRVAVRGRSAIRGVTGATRLLNGPDSITPIGIAVSSRQRSTLGFAYVQVAGRSVRLFNPGRLTVADGLLAAGISIRDLQGKVGKGLTVTFNGELRMIKGTFGRPARITVNGQPASLETPVAHRDRIAITPAVAGAPGSATVADLLEETLHSITVRLGGADRELPPIVTVNGSQAPLSTPLRDNDQVIARNRSAAADLIEYLGYGTATEPEELLVTVQGQQRRFVRSRVTVRLNGIPVGPEARLFDGVSVEVAASPPLTVRDAAGAEREEGKGLRVMVNGRSVELKGSSTLCYRNGKPVPPDEPLCDGDNIEIVTIPDRPPIFAELLVSLGVEPVPPAGKNRLRMTLNGRPAEFASPLQEGDRAEVTWE